MPCRVALRVGDEARELVRRRPADVRLRHTPRVEVRLRPPRFRAPGVPFRPAIHLRWLGCDPPDLPSPAALCVPCPEHPAGIIGDSAPGPHWWVHFLPVALPRVSGIPGGLRADRVTLECLEDMPVTLTHDKDGRMMHARRLLALSVLCLALAACEARDLTSPKRPNFDGGSTIGSGNRSDSISSGKTAAASGAETTADGVSAATGGGSTIGSGN